MPRRNRVDPWGDLHAAPGRGLLTGNRGCLVESGEVVRHHAGAAWIVCATEHGGRRQPLAAERRWTPIFFLDEAVALAAGHRPCARCRRSAYRSYRDAVARAQGCPTPLPAPVLDRRLGGERLARGRGPSRAADRRLWDAGMDTLPPGAVIVDRQRRAHLVLEDRLLPFTFDGWGRPVARRGGAARVLTPPTSVAALAHGFTPVLHPSSAGPGRPAS